MRSSPLRTMTALPPTGNPLRRSSRGGAEPIERVAAHRRVAAGEESLAGGQVRHDLHDGLAVRTEHRIAVLVDFGDRRGRSRWQGRAARRRRRSRPDGRAAAGNMKPCANELDEADLRPDRACGQIAVHAHQLAPRGRQRVVSRVADRREPDTVDSRTCGNSRSMSGWSSGSKRSSNSLSRSIT